MLKVRLQIRVDVERIIKVEMHVAKIDSTSLKEIPWTIKLG